jgi:hypothetical protein
MDLAALARQFSLKKSNYFPKMSEEQHLGGDTSHSALIGSFASSRNIALAFHEDPTGELLLRLRWKETG